ncbi:MAG TPA: hypothetical protein VFJ16_14875 [Longimicrobium sp.]|nr:hypothetical protein [Longimicrobium sp.]
MPLGTIGVDLEFIGGPPNLEAAFAVTGLPPIHLAVDSLPNPLPVIHLSVDHIDKIQVGLDKIQLGIDPLEIKITEIPKVRAHLPADFCVGLSVLGMELLNVRLCGEAQVITEPYEPNPCEVCRPIDRRHFLHDAELVPAMEAP